MIINTSCYNVLISVVFVFLEVKDFFSHIPHFLMKKKKKLPNTIST